MLMLLQPIIDDACVHPDEETLENINDALWPILK